MKLWLGLGIALLVLAALFSSDEIVAAAAGAFVIAGLAAAWELVEYLVERRSH